MDTDSSAMTYLLAGVDAFTGEYCQRTSHLKLPTLHVMTTTGRLHGSRVYESKSLYACLSIAKSVREIACGNLQAVWVFPAPAVFEDYPFGIVHCPARHVSIV